MTTKPNNKDEKAIDVVPDKPKKLPKASKVPKVIQEVNPDIPLVEQAYSELKGIFTKHYGNALLEAGRYIIENFYDNNIDLARRHKPTKGKSLNELAEKIKFREEGSPSRTWIFNAVKMVIDEDDFKSVQSYGQLQLSHKIALLPMKNREQKTLLIEQATENKYSVSKLKEKIAEGKSDKKGGLNLLRAIGNPEIVFGKKYTALVKPDYLGNLKDKEAASILEKAQKQKAKLEKEIKDREKFIEMYAQLIKALE